MPKSLDELIRNLAVLKIMGDMKVEISGISYHSQKVKPNFLFVAIDGSRTSGSKFIDEAVRKGAVAVATNQPGVVNAGAATLVQVENPKIFLAQVSNRFYNFPSQKVNLTGITGTNGKTTTAYLAKAILDTAGKTSGLLGTIQYFDGENWIKAENTTPESLDIIRMLTKLVHKGIKYCILEVSSHGLELNRVFDLQFQIAVFTNFTQDHLDFHKTFESYKQAKMKLFTGLDQNAIAVINEDDPVSVEIAKLTKARIIHFSLKNHAEITAKILNLSSKTTLVKLIVDGKETKINLRLIGSHNVYNLMAAAGIGFAYQIPLSTIKEGVERLRMIPGRLEPVENNKGLSVFVDYAHTPDALQNLIKTAREFSKKRVLLIFGCGGDRDQTKRRIMGEIATELADYVIITSDNPRNEDPNKIIDDIKTGIEKSNYEIIPDRYSAIKRIIFLAKTGDTVLIAGKGHEDYQIIGNEKKHFDDRLMAKRILES
jgi:UDP-N-acetylmuramoyl-L-alanyl-D-glutamate--2,6-diaminopimelate ligase